MSSSESLAIKSTVALRPQIYFFLCFPSLRPLVKSFYSLGCNEASFGLCLSGLNPLSFDPATNNDPLQFNGSSGPLVTECPALETSTENNKKRKRANLPPGTDSKLTAVTLPHGAFSLDIKDGLNVLWARRAGTGNFTLMKIIAHLFFPQHSLVGKNLPVPWGWGCLVCLEVRQLQRHRCSSEIVCCWCVVPR